jgi:hypothetical protein
MALHTILACPTLLSRCGSLGRHPEHAVKRADQVEEAAHATVLDVADFHGKFEYNDVAAHISKT